MLKAYNLIEREQLDVHVVETDIAKEERRLAKKFVTEEKVHLKVTDCVVCGSPHYVPFAQLNGVPYYRCEDCCSVYTPVTRETVGRYRDYAPIREFRASDEYQQAAGRKRSGIWDELLLWMNFRCARYLHRNEGLKIADVGNHYTELAERVTGSAFCGEYAAFEEVPQEGDGTADAVMYIDQLRYEIEPDGIFRRLAGMLKEGGLLIMSTRVGSGFDILTMKGNIDSIFPFEHVLLPSTGGLEMMLERNGFKLLEITTPGTLDIDYVLKKKEQLDKGDLFVNYLVNHMDADSLVEFQRFLQKSGTSSHARLIAKRV